MHSYLLILYIYIYYFIVRALLGGKVELILVGGAPLSPQTHDFIRVCLGTFLIQGELLTFSRSVYSVLTPIIRFFLQWSFA